MSVPDVEQVVAQSIVHCRHGSGLRVRQAIRARPQEFTSAATSPAVTVNASVPERKCFGNVVKSTRPSAPVSGAAMTGTATPLTAVIAALAYQLQPNAFTSVMAVTAVNPGESRATPLSVVHMEPCPLGGQTDTRYARSVAGAEYTHRC